MSSPIPGLLFHFLKRGALLPVFLLAGSLSAAPVLVDEETIVGDLPEESWLSEMPVARLAPPQALSAVDPLIAADDAYRAPRGNAGFRRIAAGVAYAGGEAAPSLKDLLRSYLRPNGAPGSQARLSIRDAQTSARRADAPGNGFDDNATENLLGRVANFVLQPAGDGGAFSLFGLDSVTLVAADGGIALAFGDLFSFSIPGTKLDISWPGTTAGSAFGPTDLTGFNLSTLQPGSTDIAPYLVNSDRWSKGGDEDRAQSNAADDVVPAAAMAQAPHMLFLLYDILTYPGTLLMLLAFLLVPLANVAKNFIGGRARRGHRLSKLRRQRRRRIGRLTASSPPGA